MLLNKDITKWTILKTGNYSTISETLEDAFLYSLLYVIVGYSGAGKSTALRDFIRSHPSVKYLRLDKTFSTKDLYVELIRLFDEHEYGYDTKVRFLAKHLTRLISECKDNVLIVIDDANRFSYPHLEFFQSVFDANEGKLGMVLSGGSKFKSDFDKWALDLRSGIPELNTRIQDWVELKRPILSELKSVAKANGVVEEIDSIVKGCNNFRTLRNRIIDQRKAKLKASLANENK